MNKRDLENLGIYSWPDIGERYSRADLLLGNGFSVRLSSALRYTFLFDRFLETLGAAADRTRFESFGTKNFETIQGQLVSTANINKLFGLPTEPIHSAMATLREGLVTTIERNHPRSQEIDRDLLTACSQTLDGFADIYTLNYDLYLYHIIMISADRNREDPTVRPYNDYFWGDSEDNGLREFRDFQNYERYDHVVYLHGALFIFPGQPEIKVLRSDGEELIDVIASRIRSGSLPLFVSEGTAEEKERSIAMSRYLRFAMRALSGCRDTVVVYGTSLGPMDQHIVEALASKRRRIAVSIHVGDKYEEDVKEQVAWYQGQLSRHDLEFFDGDTLFLGCEETT